MLDLVTTNRPKMTDKKCENEPNERTKMVLTYYFGTLFRRIHTTRHLLKGTNISIDNIYIHNNALRPNQIARILQENSQ
jgi:hypothetical protein